MSDTERSTKAPSRVRVLGIDPGTRVMGFGILDIERGGKPALVACGAVKLPPKPLATRLEAAFRSVHELIERHAPRVLALEEVFHGKNFQSVLKVGEARGVIVLAAEMAGLEITEYAPARIKKAATGNGNAGKQQVQCMMTRLLGLAAPPSPPDVTDALAVAFCHGQRRWSAAAAAAAEAPRKGQTLRELKARLRDEREGAGRKGAVAAESGQGAGARSLRELLGSGKAQVFRGERFRK